MIYPTSLNSTFTFGKHKGETVEDVIDDDPNYIEWCIETVPNFELDNEAYDYYIHNDNMYGGLTEFDTY